MKMYHIIDKKKKGEVLTKEEISFFVKGFTDGCIPDYQASALLMAICLKGMDEEETAILTEEMMLSGDVLDLSPLGEKTVDKHSTGGVGDKTTLILAPIVAASGGIVAKMTGKGLGHTGGTIDKMESVAGMRLTLTREEAFTNAEKAGIFVMGQSEHLAPADRKLYALRDVTATVDSIPLIASSIMSKKLASGAKNIVLDVKYGSGAFMKTPEDAKALAQAMVKIGKRLGRRVCAFITDMDTPLGTHIGNALEVKEAVSVLKGEGDEKLRELCLTLASAMLSLSLHISAEEGRKKAEECLSSGAAFEKMKEWFSLQGGDVSCLEHTERLPTSAYTYTVLSPCDGYLYGMNTEKIGSAACALGAGRKTKEDTIDPAAGIILYKKPGDKVKKGEKIAELFANRKELFPSSAEMFLQGIIFSQGAPQTLPLIFDTVQ